MTVYEIYRNAERKLDRNEINIGEFNKLVEIEVEPVIHAHWIYIDDGDEKYATYRCSHCHKEVTVDAERICDIGFVIEDLKRCLECGAKMEEVTE